MDSEVRDHPTNMTELREAIDAAWTRMNSMLDSIDEAAAVDVTDANGWNARDHLMNVVAWERSSLYLLQRRPRHDALGVSRETYLAEDVDATNEEIRTNNADKSWHDARAELEDNHTALMSLLDTLSWDDMQLPYSHYLPDEPGDEGSLPVGIWVFSNGSLHYDEHRRWIEELLARANQ